MSAFLEQNLNRMSGIRNTMGRIADRNETEKMARKKMLYDAFMKGAGAYNDAMKEQNVEKFQSGEALKSRNFTSDQAAKLAAERSGIRDWERNGGFDQQKELLALDAKNRMALAMLEAAAKDKKKEAFDPNMIAAQIMTLSVPGQNWTGPQWRPEVWNDDTEKSFWDSANGLLSQFPMKQQAQIKQYLNSFISQYQKEVPPEPSSNEGSSIFNPTYNGKPVYGKAEFPLFDFFKKTFSKAGNEVKKVGSNISDQVNEARVSNPPPSSPAGIQKTENTILSQTPNGSTDPNLWNVMTSLLRNVPQNLNWRDKAELGRYMSAAEDGDMQSSALTDFINFLQKFKQNSNTMQILPKKQSLRSDGLH